MKAKQSKLTKGVISRAEAVKLAPDYVKVSEQATGWGNILFDKIMPVFEKLKRGQEALTFIDGVYVPVKVSSINSKTWQAIDGPVVRVSNGEMTWRVDGDRYAFPLEISPCSHTTHEEDSP